MMKYIRILLGVFVILLLMVSAAVLLPSKVTISKSVLIDAPKTRVDQEIQDFDHWKNWYPAFQNKNIQVTSIADSEFPSMLLKDDAGKELTLSRVKADTSITQVNLESTSMTKVSYQFIAIPHRDGQTQLTLNVNTQLGWYPWEKLKGIFLDKISGPQYEHILQQLKAAAEK